MSETPALLGIVTALREELCAVHGAVESLPEARRDRVRLLRSGGTGGTAAAKTALQLAASGRVKLLCSAGFSGGLAEALGIGEVVLAEEVGARRGVEDAEQGRTPWAVHRGAFEAARDALRSAGARFHAGGLVTVAKPVFRGEDKRRLGQACGALAVDMESAAVARVAAAHGLGFFALRAVSDGVEDDLPEEVGEFLDEKGKVRAGKVVQYALGGPGRVGDLMRLKKHADRAAGALRKAWAAVLPSLMDLVEQAED